MVYQSSFYFIDDTKTIYKLDMDPHTHLLNESCELYVKDKDLPHFKCHPFSNMIISHQYIIYESKVFYL